MKAKEFLTRLYENRYGTQKYTKSNLHSTYEDLVIDAMEGFAAQSLPPPVILPDTKSISEAKQTDIIDFIKTKHPEIWKSSVNTMADVINVTHSYALSISPAMANIPSEEETDVSKAIRLIHEWLKSDDCWVEDQDGNKIKGAIITGNGNSLYDHVSNGLGLPPIEGWINIKDGLPELGDKIDVWLNSKNQILADIEYVDTFWSDITFWKPRTKPPQLKKQ